MSNSNIKLTYKFQNADSRDYKYQAISTNIPSSSTTLQNIASKYILNQGDLGDCVSNAFALCITIITNGKLQISRLLHYAFTRIIENTPLSEDSGLYVRDGCKSISKYGVCSEDKWPHNTKKYNILPELNVINSSKYLQNYSYVFLNQDIQTLKTYLSTKKSPIIFGFMVYNSFMNIGSNGIVPVPNTSTETLQGGHCALIVGYNDSTQMFICANSWGKSWGNKGFFYMPYKYISNSSLSSDFCGLQFTYSLTNKKSLLPIITEPVKNRIISLKKMRFT
jgi:hypothetical protein